MTEDKMLMIVFHAGLVGVMIDRRMHRRAEDFKFGLESNPHARKHSFHHGIISDEEAIAADIDRLMEIADRPGEPCDRGPVFRKGNRENRLG
jgi:hypothetical protein